MTGFTLIGGAAQVSTGGPEWNQVDVQLKTLAMASVRVVGLLHSGFSLGTRENLPHSNNCQPPSPQSQMDAFCFHGYDHLATIFVPATGLEGI